MRRTNPFAVLAGTSSSTSSSEKPQAAPEEEYYPPPRRWMGRTKTALRKERKRQLKEDAEYAAEKPLPNFSGDRTVMYRLMLQVNAMRPDTTKTFELRVKFHGYYTVKLIVKKTGINRLEFYLNENECIYIIYERSHPDAPYMSQLYADTAERRCFQPAPNTSQFRMLDLLMVLTTKLMIAIEDFFDYEGKADDEYYEEHRGITITDIAKKDGVALTPYKIMRGEDGIYERYGYVSSTLDKIKHRLPSLRVNSLPYPAHEGLEAVLGRKLAAGELVMPLMANVTWENERDYGISEAIVDDLIPMKGDGWMAEGGSIDMVLVRDSDAWAEWDAEMQLTGVRRPRTTKKTRRRR
jgi:hypothetical protein